MANSPAPAFGRLSPVRKRQREKVLAHRSVKRMRVVASQDRVSYFYNARGQLFKSVVSSPKKNEWHLVFVEFSKGKPTDVGRAFFDLTKDRSSFVISWVDKMSAVMHSIDSSVPIKDRGIDFFRVVLEAAIRVARKEEVPRITLVASLALAKYYSKYGFRKSKEYSPGRIGMVLDYTEKGNWQPSSHTF